MASLTDHEEILMTGEELFYRPDLEPCELVNGRVVPLPFAVVAQALAQTHLAGELHDWIEATGLGKGLMGNVGVYIRRNPDTVRAADVLFISNERLARRGPSEYLDVAPELVVEVLHPDQRWSEVMDKVEDYFSAGVVRVWVVDPYEHRIFAYRSPTEVEQFGEGQVLIDEKILPGFRLNISEVFHL